MASRPEDLRGFLRKSFERSRTTGHSGSRMASEETLQIIYKMNYKKRTDL